MSLLKSSAFCPKNYVISVAWREGGLQPPRPSSSSYSYVFNIFTKFCLLKLQHYSSSMLFLLNESMKIESKKKKLGFCNRRASKSVPYGNDSLQFNSRHFSPREMHLCPGLNAVTNFTIFRKFRSFRSFRNFRNFRNFGQGFPATLDNQASLNEQWP